MIESTSCNELGSFVAVADKKERKFEVHFVERNQTP
jgi:hypothetical protein